MSGQATMTTSTAERVKKHRDALRAAGLRPLQIWVPDTRSPAFATECRRQSLLVAEATAHESETLLWLEKVADTEGWR